MARWAPNRLDYLPGGVILPVWELKLAHPGDLISTYMPTSRQEAHIIPPKLLRTARVKENVAQDGFQERLDNPPDPQNPSKTLSSRSFFNFAFLANVGAQSRKIL